MASLLGPKRLLPQGLACVGARVGDQGTGSNLGNGNGNSHDTKNMPVVLAGGGFKHGQHLAFDPANNAPLCNLFVSMLQRLNLEVDSFASSTGKLSGLVAN